MGKIKQQNKSGIVINFGGLHLPYGEGREYFVSRNFKHHIFS